METLPAPPLPPLVHVALTVSDLERSVAWYTAVFGEPPTFTGELLVGTPHHYRLAVWLSMQLGLHCFADSTPGEFSERRPGLDHVAFACASVTELAAWAERLDRLGVPHGEILTEPYGSGLAFRDPDGIALELFVSGRNT
jgi:glyoxylase I family protein